MKIGTRAHIKLDNKQIGVYTWEKVPGRNGYWFIANLNSLNGIFNSFEQWKIQTIMYYPGLTYTILDLDSSTPEEEVENMDKTIAEVYEKTADAILVNKWFGSALSSELDKLVVKLNKEAVLEEAKKKEEEWKASLNK